MRIMKTWGLSIIPTSLTQKTRAISDLPVSNPFSFLELPQLFKEPVKSLENVAEEVGKFNTKA